MRRQAPTAAPVKPRWWAAAGALVCWLAIYLPEAGRGFIKDDFAWLLAAPLAADPWNAAWSAPTGFFRPLVSLSFTINHSLFGLAPPGYGLTNLLLAILCAGAVYALGRSWHVAPAGAAIAAFIWLFTPHGMDMAVIWISGRSALLLVLFAVSAAACFARGRRGLALVLTAAALLSKDEAVVMPVLLTVSALAAGRFDRRRDAAAIAASVALAGLYLWMRAGSGAHMPWNAPADYRPVLDAGHLVRNLAQYADRIVTFPLVLTLLAWIVTMRGIEPAVHASVAGLPWAIIAMLPTLALPVRSSLYVLLPLAGTAILAGHVIHARLAAAPRRKRQLAAAATVLLLVTLVPFHRSRQREWSGAARLSAQITRDVQSVLGGVPAGAKVSVQDRVQQPNLESTFGTLLPEMLQVVTGKQFELVHAPAPGTSILLAPVPR